MTAKAAYSRRAAAEVEEITASVAELSPSAAERFSQALARAEQQLADFPNSGAPGRLPGTRRLVVANYILSYRRRGEDVEIFSVRNARRRDTRP